MAGTPINWDISVGNSILNHPLYIEYNNKTVQDLLVILPLLKADLAGIMVTRDNAPIIAYLSWLLRLAALAQ